MGVNIIPRWCFYYEVIHIYTQIDLIKLIKEKKKEIASLAVWQPRSEFWASSTLIIATYARILIEPPMTLSHIFSKAE